MAEGKNVIQQNLTTLHTHLHYKKEQRGQVGDLPAVIHAIALACKAIADKVRRARLEDVIGEVGAINVQGATASPQ